MPSFTLTPVAVTAHGWVNGDQASWMSDASDATYMNTLASETVTNRFSLTDLPADAAAISGDVTWNARMVFTGDPPTVTSLFRYSGTDSTGTLSPGIDVTITNHTSAFALAPGSVDWTPTILNATEIGVTSTTGVLDFTYCYEMSATGTYLQAGETFVSIYNLVGPMLFGAGLTLADMWAAAGKPLYSGRTKLLYQPQEIRQAWDEYKAHRFPTYHFRGASLGV